jgi:hypothetical protein
MPTGEGPPEGEPNVLALGNLGDSPRAGRVIGTRPSAACDLYGLRTRRLPGYEQRARGMHEEGTHSMDSSESVHFDLADGTSVAVESSDYRRVYDELWRLSPAPGAVSTAGLLLDATRHPGYPHAVDLSKAQSAALRSAVDHSKTKGRTGEPNALALAHRIVHKDSS